MTRFKKLKDKIEQEEIRKDIKYDELKRYLEHYGYYLDRINGSHHIFKRNENSITIPVHKNSVKAVYIKQATEKIKMEEQTWPWNKH